MIKSFYSQINIQNILIIFFLVCCFLGYLVVRGPGASVKLADLPQDIDLVLVASSSNENKPTLQKFHGRPLLMHFWATWCQSCKLEYPRLARLSESIEDPNRILAVATFDQRPDVFASAVVQNRKLSVAYDDQNRLAQGLGFNSIPQTYLFDGKGNLVRHYRGQIPQAELARIRKLLCPECN